MLTARQNFLETLKKDGKPDRLCAGLSAFQFIYDNPVSRYVRASRVPGTRARDRWGTLLAFPENLPGAVPIVTKETQVIQDIERWRDFVKVPDLRANCSTGWEKAQANRAAIDSREYLRAVILGTGIFEQLHMLMGFEDTLCGFLLNPDEMHELIGVIAEYRLEFMKLVVENLHPDAVLSHDDWGARDRLFMSPGVWREFFKEPYRMLYSYLRENGVIVIHHSDSFCEPLAEDMAEIGIDAWQGVVPTNDIVKISSLLDGRMALMGGVDSSIDRADAGEEEIRAEVRRALREYGGLKNFMPGITYGGTGTIYPHVEPIVYDEIERYNKERFGI